jgi:predicted transcriptional regulator
MAISSNDIEERLTSAEKGQLERFLTAQNRIEKHLRSVLKQLDRVSYSRLLCEYADLEKGWRDAARLLECAHLRNSLIHERQVPFDYQFVPTLAIVEDIEASCDRLLQPELVIPRFAGPVTMLDSTDSLEQALRHIVKYGYSQFPVFKNEQYRGLLTENGITRWLGNYARTKLSLVELTDVSVDQILNEEEPREKDIFVSAATTVTHILGQFIAMPQLEVILISQTGKPSVRMKGIVTRWDIVQLLRDKKKP